MSARFGISNISMLSLNDTLGVLLPEDGAECGREFGVSGGDVVSNTILSVDTEGVSVIANGRDGFSFLVSFRRVNVSLYIGAPSISSSPLEINY